MRVPGKSVLGEGGATFAMIYEDKVLQRRLISSAKARGSPHFGWKDLTMMIKGANPDEAVAFASHVPGGGEAKPKPKAKAKDEKAEGTKESDKAEGEASSGKVNGVKRSVASKGTPYWMSVLEVVLTFLLPVALILGAIRWLTRGSASPLHLPCISLASPCTSFLPAASSSAPSARARRRC